MRDSTWHGATVEPATAPPAAAARSPGVGGARWRTPLDLTGYVDLGGHDSAQVFTPALATDGEPRLQPGETVVTRFDTVGAGIRSGRSPVRHAGGSMEVMDGRCFVTTTRLVFVCHRWQLGGDLSSARSFFDGVIDDPRDDARERTGRPLALGPRLLVGQVRWPWLAGVVSARASRRSDGLIEMRCVQAEPARDTSVFLSLVPDPHVDVDDVVRSIVDAAREDRLGYRDLGPGELGEPSIAIVPSDASRWTTIPLPGAYDRRASTAANGGRSAVALAPWRHQLVDHLTA